MVKSQNLCPVTEETIHKYAASIFTPIRRGECVTTVWVPMAGRRVRNCFIIDNLSLFEKELPDYKDYLLVYVEPLELTEESLSGHLRLMGKSLLSACEKNETRCREINLGPEEKTFDDETIPYAKLLQALRSAIKKTVAGGKKVVFFLGEFDELSFANSVFYNNIKSLWSEFRPSLQFIFLMREGVSQPEKVARWGEFNEVILQNIQYVSILNDKDIDYVLNSFRQEFHHEISSEDASLLKKICGGHPYSLKAGARIINGYKNEKINIGDLERLLFSHYELRSITKGIIEVLTDEEKQVLKKIAKDKKIEAEERFILAPLLELGLVKLVAEEKYKFYGQLFAEEVSNGKEKKVLIPESEGKEGLSIEEKTGVIFYDGLTVEEKFTPQEYSLLAMFLKKPNTLHTRDNVGETLWGKDSYEKYSDWAIDQIVSKLRRKLKNLQVKERLVTIRSRGYKLIRSAS